MVNQRILAKTAAYLEIHCLDQRWFDYRKKLGRPVDLLKVKHLKETMLQTRYPDGRTDYWHYDKVIEYVKAIYGHATFR